MHCDGCAGRLRARLETAAGVREVAVSFAERQARVVYDAHATEERRLVDEIEKSGFRVAGRPNDTHARTGTISRISHWVDAKTRTMAVEADVYQGAPILDRGMFAEVMWSLRGEAPSLFVPASAVVESAQATFVERVRQGKVERVPVHRDSTMGDLVEVFGALEPENLVLVRGSEELENGAEVLPRVQGSSGG